MSNRPLNALVRHIYRRAGAETPDAGDHALLTAFVTRHDEAAFAALVERHGPLVWGLCRRLLANGDDAEDAFLALVRHL